MAYYLNELGIICALGSDKRSVYSATVQGSQTGMVPSDRFSPGNEVFLGFVSGELPHIPSQLNEFDCRNNRLLLAALGQIRESVDRCIARFGADRVGVALDREREVGAGRDLIDIDELVGFVCLGDVSRAANHRRKAGLLKLTRLGAE